PGAQPRRRRATVSALDFRRVSACALPRPSATASARLANSTVSHSQNTMSPPNQLGWDSVSTVDHTAPISTTNITGLRHRVRGLSLPSASGTDLSSRAGSSRPPWTRRCDTRGTAARSLVCESISVDPLSEGSQGQRGQEGQGYQDDRHTHH